MDPIRPTSRAFLDPTRPGQAAALMAACLPALSLLAACGGTDAQCAIDTDCPVLQRCEANRCLPLGAADSGPPPAVDAGARDTGAPLDSGPPPVDAGPARRGFGSVLIAQTRSADVLVGYNAAASFQPAESRFDCTTTVAGTCTAIVCLRAISTADAGMVDGGLDGGLDGGPAPPAPHAGVISVTGGMADVMLSPDPMTGVYATVTGPAGLWTGAEMLTVSAAGDTVPAFSQSLTPPVRVLLTAPALPAAPAEPLAIPLTADLVATWTPGGTTGGSFIVLLGQSVTTLDSVTNTTLYCTFPLADGAGSVPASLLALIAAGPMGTYSFYVGQLTTVEPAGWSIVVAAGEYATDPAARVAMGTASFM